jgi:hypothetical protein
MTFLKLIFSKILESAMKNLFGLINKWVAAYFENKRIEKLAKKDQENKEKLDGVVNDKQSTKQDIEQATADFLNRK